MYPVLKKRLKKSFRSGGDAKKSVQPNPISVPDLGNKLSHLSGINFCPGLVGGLLFVIVALE